LTFFPGTSFVLGTADRAFVGAIRSFDPAVARDFRGCFALRCLALLDGLALTTLRLRTGALFAIVSLLSSIDVSAPFIEESLAINNAGASHRTISGWRAQEGTAGLSLNEDGSLVLRTGDGFL
jgi:hypothetical protein